MIHPRLASYVFDINGSILDQQPVVKMILQDYLNKVPVEKIAARFHNGVIQACLEACNIIRDETGLSTVALSGGVWQNVYPVHKNRSNS